MARTPKFTFKNTSRGWQVNVPATLAASGKRERQFFETRDKAKAAAAALREKFLEHGAAASVIRPALAEDASRAAAILEPWGVSLTDAAKFYAAARDAEAASVPTNTALEQWISDMETRLRGRSVTNYKQTKRRFAVLGEKQLAAVTRAELQEIIAPAGMPATSAAANYRNGLAFWNWAARRGWCLPEVFAKLDRPANPQRKAIEFLEIEAVRALLDTAAAHFPAAVGAFAVAIFAGVRPAEIPRLDPALVKPDGIDVGADDAKGDSRRHITPGPTLAAWLTAFPFKKVKNWNRVYDAVRRLAGWELDSAILKKRTDLQPATRGKWPQDAMRHTAGTYHVAYGVELAGMAFWFGHTGGETTLRRHYVGRAKRHQAIEFFAIMPPGVEAPATIHALEGAA